MADFRIFPEQAGQLIARLRLIGIESQVGEQLSRLLTGQANMTARRLHDDQSAEKLNTPRSLVANERISHEIKISACLKQKEYRQLRVFGGFRDAEVIPWNGNSFKQELSVN